MDQMGCRSRASFSGPRFCCLSRKAEKLTGQCETRGRGSGKPTQEFRFGIKHEEGPEYGRIELLNPGCHGNHAVVCTGRDGGPVLTPAGTKGEEGCSLD